MTARSPVCSGLWLQASRTVAGLGRLACAISHTNSWVHTAPPGPGRVSNLAVSPHCRTGASSMIVSDGDTKRRRCQTSAGPAPHSGAPANFSGSRRSRGCLLKCVGPECLSAGRRCCPGGVQDRGLVKQTLALAHHHLLGRLWTRPLMGWVLHC